VAAQLARPLATLVCLYGTTTATKTQLCQHVRVCVSVLDAHNDRRPCLSESVCSSVCVAWFPVHWYLPTRQIEEPWCPSSWYYPDMPLLPVDLVEIATRWLASLRYPCETCVSVSLIAVNVLYKSIWWGYPLCVCKILRNVFDMPFRSVLCCGRLTFDLYYSADPAYTQYSKLIRARGKFFQKLCIFLINYIYISL